MKDAKRLPTLKNAVYVLEPAMVKFHRDHQAYKFQVNVSVVFHKAVDPDVVMHQPVVLTPEMVATYADAAPPLDDVNRQLLNFRSKLLLMIEGLETVASSGRCVGRHASCRC